ncbi:membrane protein [Sulfurimicrobium lacus]|uniref:Membrane protein n=1 Tax=Sulfurimicrobium lacus TaxID=2715678 RepID=A0A6F8VCZ6_9PROT|nr:MMPL family transporter [Sulfurimicrobium lacus]BCB26635.1 membrane protein [Sulfurimicrobium lacus]
MKRWPVAIWLAGLAFCIWIVAAHTRINTDMAAFLPDSASPAQQLMVEQLRDGVTSRIVMFALEGAEARQLAETSKKLARALEASGHFSYVRSGEQALTPVERERLMRYRYLLSPATDAAHFSAGGLQQSLQDSLQLLASPAGAMIKQLLPSDPTGEMLALLESWGGTGSGPGVNNGVWFSADGKRALLLAETKAPAFDIDAQQKVGDDVRRIFATTRTSPEIKLLMSGPSIFAVESRNRIHDDAWRLSMIATALVAVILLVAYGSPRLLVLGMLPVASGALAGLTAVSLGYGTVHGITMGFGVTLIGEAVDYPTYLFTQRAPHESLRQTLQRIWPTLRLAVLTTVFGSLTMLLSGFSGLSQLGMFSLAGVLTAGLMTRFVIPEIAPARLEVAERTATQAVLARSATALTRLRWAPLAVLLCAAVYLAVQGKNLWENDLANLSPVSQKGLDMEHLDQSLRDELGAPDVRYLIAVQGSDQQAALERSEQLAPTLQTLVRQGVISGFDLAARVIPSQKVQAARQAALPDQETLRRNLQAALAATPFKPDVFEPFLHDVERSRHLPLLQPEVWHGTPLGSLAQGMLVKHGTGWVALISLRGVKSDAELATFMTGLHDGNAFLLDIKGESNKMITQYRDQSLLYSIFGVAAIVAVLGFGLRNFRAVFSVMLPVSAAILGTTALLALLGIKLSLFHVVSLLLVLGIGLNYGLFINLPASDEKERRRALFSTLVCVASTVSAFGALAFSASPVLQAIGGTVALGAVLSLVFAAMWAESGR